ncbi:MAG TPA: hypothetical protein VFA12_09780 [Stellaceae bacterium]|nr:hypothetical protein [Stellaceae bacterium]
MALLAGCGVLAGCGFGQRLHRTVESVSGGMADRCAEFMRAAFPSAELRVTKSEAADADIHTIVAHVEAVRRNLPPNVPLVHDLAVECRFTDSILTGFRWTAGPLH